ncbi:hypothetical protein PHSC3_001052 [Chlamydiales bacterium STE3]|nr:hypothetical protein PHSC3_001052 [Chlamydiales bacterium STE3]
MITQLETYPLNSLYPPIDAESAFFFNISEIALSIFAHLDHHTLLVTLPLVCRSWNCLAGSKEVCRAALKSLGLKAVFSSHPEAGSFKDQVKKSYEKYLTRNKFLASVHNPKLGIDLQEIREVGDESDDSSDDEPIKKQNTKAITYHQAFEYVLQRIEELGKQSHSKDLKSLRIILNSEDETIKALDKIVHTKILHFHYNPYKKFSWLQVILITLKTRQVITDIEKRGAEDYQICLPVDPRPTTPEMFA